MESKKEKPFTSEPLATREDFEKTKVEAAKAATARGDTLPKDAIGVARPYGAPPPGKQWVQGAKGGWALADEAKPEDMQINPDLPTLDFEPLKQAEVQPVQAVQPLKQTEPTKSMVKAPTISPPAPVETPMSEPIAEVNSEVNPEVVEEEPASKKEKSNFGTKIKELANKYGVPALEILQAVGYQRGGIDKPTLLEKKYEEKIAQEERDWAKKLDEERTAKEEEIYQRRINEQREWEAAQAELNRIAEKEARGEELTMREKIAKMQLEAGRGSARGTAGTASIIPE